MPCKKTTIQVDKEVREALSKMRRKNDLSSANVVIKKLIKKEKMRFR